MRAGRALLALDRYAEARSALDLAHELDPDGPSIRDAREQAGYLLRCHAKEQAALVSRKPQTDLIGIRRGRCKVAGCDCEGYVQKVASHAVLLAGRYVRHDNNPTFFRCLRCGCESYRHVDAREIYDPRPGPRKEREAQEALRKKIEARENRPVPHTSRGEGARGGLDSAYYYAAVGAEGTENTARVPASIDAAHVVPGEPGGGAAAAGGGKASGGYYYAHHAQPTEYKVPVVPQRLGADGTTTDWDGAADAAARAAARAADDAARAEAVAATDAEMGELRARGGDVDALWGLAHAGERGVLAEALRGLGYSKLGPRKQLEQLLLEMRAPPEEEPGRVDGAPIIEDLGADEKPSAEVDDDE